MRLMSVNVGQPQPIKAKSGQTGIFKKPVSGPVDVGRRGLEGDSICDTENHGGPDQAVYLYASEDYRWWSIELAQEMEIGTFGENLTTEGLDPNELAIGDRIEIGEAVLQVTAPRIPCVTLERRMEETGFVRRFIAARRPGVYLRVLKEGAIESGDAIRHIPNDGERIPVLELMDDFYRPVLTETTIRRFLAVPLAERARIHKEAQLAALRSPF